MASSDASSNVKVSLRDFLNWTGLPDLPPQPEELWNQKIYPAGTMPNGDWRRVKIEIYDNSHLRLLQNLPIDPQGTTGTDCTIGGRLLFQGLGKDPEVIVSSISYYPDSDPYARAEDFSPPDRRQVQSICQAFAQAMTGRPIGSPDNPWEDIHSGVNADRLRARTAPQGGTTLAPDIMTITRRMCPS